MLLAIADLLVLCGAAAVCWARPNGAASWVLVVCSALWLPLNNGHLEGPVLITVTPNHGLTAADLIGYGGWIVAAWTLRRVRGPKTGARWLPVTAATLVLVCGVAVSYFVQPADDGGGRHHHRYLPSASYGQLR
jgi:hypothetical protein